VIYPAETIIKFMLGEIILGFTSCQSD